MSPETRERIEYYFSGHQLYGLTTAMTYLDAEMEAGTISSYRIHSCLPNSSPSPESRYLAIQVDGVDIAEADFGVEGVLFSMVEEDKELGILEANHHLYVH